MFFFSKQKECRNKSSKCHKRNFFIVLMKENIFSNSERMREMVERRTLFHLSNFAEQFVPKVSILKTHTIVSLSNSLYLNIKDKRALPSPGAKESDCSQSTVQQLRCNKLCSYLGWKYLQSSSHWWSAERAGRNHFSFLNLNLSNLYLCQFY